MILVDTSAWILSFGRTKNRFTEFLTRQINARARIVTTGVIVQEVLQGARSDRHFEQLLNYMLVPELLPEPDRITYEDAAKLYATCRWQGITPRSASDCLIAQLAIKYDAQLLHDDRDFRLLQNIAPTLKLIEP